MNKNETKKRIIRAKKIHGGEGGHQREREKERKKYQITSLKLVFTFMFLLLHLYGGEFSEHFPHCFCPLLFAAFGNVI